VFVCCVCAVLCKYRSLRRADLSVRGVLPSVCVCVCVCVFVCLIVGDLETGGLGCGLLRYKKKVTERLTWRGFVNTVIHVQSNS
jgi:hypothetical protein